MLLEISDTEEYDQRSKDACGLNDIQIIPHPRLCVCILEQSLDRAVEQEQGESERPWKIHILLPRGMHSPLSLYMIMNIAAMMNIITKSLVSGKDHLGNGDHRRARSDRHTEGDT